LSNFPSTTLAKFLQKTARGCDFSYKCLILSNLQLKNFFIFLTPYDVGCLRGYPIISRMKTKIMNSQLELSLPKQRQCRSLERPRRRHSRASFWFQRMRHVVENATDWPAPPGHKAGIPTP